MKIDPEKFLLICGPCVLEKQNICFEIAAELVRIQKDFNIQVVYKASYLKANRSSSKSFRGPGLKKGLALLEKIKNKFNLPILTDVHESSELEAVSKVADIIQIPAFLSRQTILLEKAGKTSKWINIKKAQFMAPWDIKNAYNKVLATGNKKILITERGTSFGYNNLIVDFRSLILMQEFGFHVIFDATHSVQLPSSKGTVSGGDRNLASKLAYAAAAVGIKSFFFETHPTPESALCDGANSIYLSNLSEIVHKLLKLSQVL